MSDRRYGTMMRGHFWRKSTLRRAAMRYAQHGWRVIPGAVFTVDRFACGPVCPTVGCHPAIDRWQSVASNRLVDVNGWWLHTAYSVLLVTGRDFDVIEVPARLGSAAVRRAPDAVGPVAAASGGRWLFFVEPGEVLRPELSAQVDVVLHGRDSWIAAPPTPTPEGPVRWRVSPAAVSWRLPDPYTVQGVLVDQMGPRSEQLFNTCGVTRQ